MKNTKTDNLLKQAFASLSNDVYKVEGDGKGGLKAVHLRKALNLLASVREEYWAA